MNRPSRGPILDVHGARSCMQAHWSAVMSLFSDHCAMGVAKRADVSDRDDADIVIGSRQIPQPHVVRISDGERCRVCAAEARDIPRPARWHRVWIPALVLVSIVTASSSDDTNAQDGNGATTPDAS